MATRLFLHAAANALSGTFPTAEQSVTFSARYVATGGNTLRTMNSLTGVSQTTLVISTSSSATYEAFWSHFCSPALNGTQTIGASAQELTLNIGRDVSSTAASATAVGMNLYVWRPSTGAKVGTIFDGTMNPIDVNAGISKRTFNATISAAASVVALDGDVLIVEAWQKLKPVSAIARSLTLYYDGTVVSTTQSATSSNHAAFLNFATDTLVFQQPPASASFAQTLGAVTLQGVGSSPRNGSFNNTLATVALVGVGTSPRNGSFNNTLSDAGLSATGLVGVALGTFNNALATVVVSGVGAVPHASTFTNTLGAVALIGTAAVPGVAVFDGTLGVASLSGAGEVVELQPVTGEFNVTLRNLSLVSIGGDDVAQSLFNRPTDSAGSGASRTGQRKKFVVPSMEATPYVDRMFDDLATPTQPAPAPEVIKAVKRATLITDSLAQMAPKLAPPPAPPEAQRVAPAEPDDDLDMILMAMLL